MGKRTRRGVLGAGIAGLGAAAVAACGTGTAPGASQAQPGAKAPATIVYWSRLDPSDWQKLEAPILEYRKRHPEIKIDDQNTQMSDAEFSPKLLAAFASGAAPDTFWNATRWLRPWHAAGGVADLTAYYSKARLTADKFYGNSIEELTVDGKTWGVPQGWGIGLLGVNKSLFQGAGFELKPGFDKTWTNEQFVDLTKRVSRSDGAGNLGTWGTEFGTGLTTLMPLLWAFGADLLDKDKKKAVIAQTTASVQALQWWADLTQVHRVQPRRAGDDRPQGINMWNGGRQGVNSNAGPNVLVQWNNFDFAWDVALRPIGPKGRPHRFYSNAYYMWKDSKAKDAAWDYLSWAGTDGMKFTEDAGGYNIPGYRPIADTIWVKKRTNDVDRQPWLDAAKDGRAQPLVVQWDEMNAITVKHMADLWDQKIPAKMAVDNIDREVSALLGG